MKTIQIGLEWFPEQGGGLDRVYYDCTRYLPQVGVEVKGLVAASPQVNQATEGQVQAFATPDSSLWQRWQAITKLFSQIKTKEHYDLIVSHFALYTFPLLNQLGKLPLVFHFHGPWALESDVEKNKAIAVWLKKNLEKITYHRATRFIVLSQAFRNILHREYQISEQQIHVIPGGVEPQRFAVNLSVAEAKRQLGWSQDRPIIFCIRRLAQRMGLENLISAIKQVRQIYPDVLLYVAGKGSLAQTLQAQIEELELTQNVQLLGYISDEQLPIAYRAANFSVIPTISFEGFGLVVIESLAAGTPVLGTPVGGIPEILQPFCSDLLFEDSSVDKLARGIIEALSGERQLPTSDACQTYIRDNYAWEIIATKIKAVYEKALSD